MRKVLSIMLFLGAISHQSMSQAVYREVNCAALLSEAENDFAVGRFYGIPTLLKGCIDENQFSNEENMRVYMLLTQVYLLTDEPLSAEESYLKLLGADPEFVAAPEKDPIDVVYLSKKFTTTPIFTPHFKLGGNLSRPAIIHSLNTFSTNETRVDIKSMLGLTLGGGIEWNINDNLGIGAEALAAFKAFQTTTERILVNDYQRVIERQYWLDVPVYVRYGDNVGKVRPYGYAGYALNFLVADRLNLVYNNRTANVTEEDPTVGPNIGIEYKRFRLNGSLVFGGGVKYKWGKNFFLVDLRYMAGLTNVTNGKTNYYDDDGSYNLSLDVTRYSNVSDFFRINTYALSFGFVRPLYDPRRVGKAKTKGVSRKISNE